MDLMDVEEVVGIAHEEGYREAAAAVLCQCEDTIATEGVMTLHELAKLLGKGLIEVYIPLLYLMFEGKLVLWQEEFFGEIMVQGCPAAEGM
jgi:segregation and condensation protein A